MIALRISDMELYNVKGKAKESKIVDYGIYQPSFFLYVEDRLALNLDLDECSDMGTNKFE